MSRENHPLYISAVNAYLRLDLNEFHRVRNSAVLSQDEASLLSCRDEIRQKNWTAALALTLSLSQHAETFLQAEAHFLRAMTLFWRGQIEDALVSNLSAYELYSKCQDRRGQFLSLYNTSVDYNRLGCLKIADHYLKLAQAIANSPDEKVLVLRGQACSESKANNISVATKLIVQAMDLFHDLSPLDQQGLLAVGVDIFARAGDFKRAEETIDQILAKTHKNNREYPRVHFEKCLLRFQKESFTFSNVPESLKHSDEYSLKWRLLSCLQSGQQEDATALWKKLEILLPQSIGKAYLPLNKSDEKELFFQTISKITSKTTNQQKTNSEVQAGKLGELISLLNSANMPLRKEEIIEKLWQIPYEPSLDSRFYKLIERAKKQSGINIVSAQRAYRIVAS